MVDMHGLDTVHGCCFDASAADAGVSDVALTTLTSTTSHVHFGDAHSSSSWHCISMYVYAQCNLPLDGNAGKLGTLSENVSVNVSVNNLLAISKSNCDNRDNPGQCICFVQHAASGNVTQSSVLHTLVMLPCVPACTQCSAQNILMQELEVSQHACTMHLAFHSHAI